MAEALWGIGKLKETIDFLGSKEEKQAQEKYKLLYEKECGLPYDHPICDKMERFIAWMKASGALFENIRMKYYGPDYRGVHATKDIQKNEMFLHVPLRLLITPKCGRDTVIGSKLVKSGITLSWDYLVYITIFLLTHFHDPNSPFKPYLDVFPQNVSSFPIFYSEEEKKMLTGSCMTEQVNSEVQELQEEYNDIAKAVPEFTQFPLHEYMKIKTLVISRIFYVTVHGISERIMVPLAGNNKLKAL